MTSPAVSLFREFSCFQRRAADSRRRVRVRLNSSREEVCPYSVLEIERGATKAEIRTAYLQKIKQLHPDVNREDTTSQASLVNLAYEILCDSQGAAAIIETDEGWQRKDEFDAPSGAPDVLFVNPFRCLNINPLEWRALQSLAGAGGDPEATLTENGVTFAESAIALLTPEQMRAVEAELDRMGMTLDFDFCEWTLADYLSRARRANQMR